MAASIDVHILLRLRPYPMRGHRLLCNATSSIAAASSVVAVQRGSSPHVALQAHDWQAYQELLAKQKGPEGASERYEVINRFLDDTEDYLHKLAGKVASVKLSQEASEAAAQAMAEARAQVCYCLLAAVVHLVPGVALCFYAYIYEQTVHMESSRLCVCKPHVCGP